MHSSTNGRNPPRLRLADPEEVIRSRRATWLELFSDLVFVVAVAELAHLLADQVSPGIMLVYTGLFFPVWWAWAGQTFRPQVPERAAAPAPAPAGSGSGSLW